MKIKCKVSKKELRDLDEVINYVVNSDGNEDIPKQIDSVIRLRNKLDKC